MSIQVRPFCALLIGFLAIHLLTGCGAIAGAMIGAALTGAAAGEVVNAAISPTGLPPPEISCSNGNTITVVFGSSAEDDQEDKAGELISEHCGGAYSVTRRVDQIAWHAIDATCGGLEARPETEPPCQFDAAGRTGFGETE